jgi:hypothetical protein
MKQPAREKKPPSKPDAETRALSGSPVFQALIAEGRASRAEGWTSVEELNAKKPLPVDAAAFGQTYSLAMAALEEVQGSTASDSQGLLVRTVLSAVDVLRGKGTVEQLAREAGVPARSVRAVALAMETADRTSPVLANAG